MSHVVCRLDELADGEARGFDPEGPAATQCSRCGATVSSGYIATRVRTKARRWRGAGTHT